jgi:hypothetical protein
MRIEPVADPMTRVGPTGHGPRAAVAAAPGRDHPRGRGRLSDERGSALVEFAIVASLLFVLVFGVFETGMAWSDSQLVTQAARTGARSAAQLGVGAQADSFAVESIEAALGDLTDNVTRIVIYDAAAADGSMPPACAGASPPGVNGQCSIYDRFDFGTYGSWVDGAWPPADRDNTLLNGNSVGVLVEIDRPLLTRFLGGSGFTIADTTVMKIEPDAGS